MKRLVTIAFCMGIFLTAYAQNSEMVKLEQKAKAGDAKAQTELGDKFYAQKRYEEAFQWYKKAAENGDVRGISQLSLCYCNGKGVIRDYATSIVYTKKAAEMGHPYAQYHLATHYEDGRGITKDSLQAYEWYKKAADNHYDEAAYKVAAYNFWGKGGHAKDYSTAAEYFKKSSKEYGKYLLGWMYEKGKGVETNLPKAFENYCKSADASKAALTGLTNWANYGNSDAQYWLAEYFRKKAIKLDIESDSASYWYKQALPWYEKAANQGNAEAAFELGTSYYNGGYGLKQDYSEAAKWLKVAAEKNHIGSIEWLAPMYYEGEGVKKDYDEVVRLCNKGIYLKEKEGREKKYNYIYTTLYSVLGDCYLYGYGVEKNESKAFELYCKNDDETSLRNQSYCYKNGIGTQKNYKKAFECLENAVEGGGGWARYELAKAYEDGVIVKRNMSKAFEIYNKLANEEYYLYIPEAKNDVARCLIYGLGTQRNVQEGIKWYRRSIEEDNDSWAMYSLAKIYYDGKVLQRTKEREKELFDLLTKSVNNRYVYHAALRLLAACYRYGIGTEVNPQKDEELLQRAAEYKDEVARRILGKGALK